MTATSDDTDTDRSPIASQQVYWWPVYEHAVKHAAGLGVNLAEGLPVAGTPSWCLLADDDNRKHAAVLLAGAQYALYLDGRQQARAEASRAVAGAADWRKVAQEVQQRNAFRQANPWAKRRVR